MTLWRRIVQRIQRLVRPDSVYYIGGSDTLPPPLPREEEAALLERLPEEKARQVLIERNLRLVVYIAKRFDNTGINIEDLISIGTIGLIKAVNTFRTDKNIKLATYASRCIENEILMTLRASRKRRGDVSLSEPIGTDGEGNDITFMDVLGTDQDELEETVIRHVTLEKIHRVLSRLPARERLVLEMRYGLADGTAHPQHEIARLLGISRSYVSRVEKHAVTLLRQALEER